MLGLERLSIRPGTGKAWVPSPGTRLDVIHPAGLRADNSQATTLVETPNRSGRSGRVAKGCPDRNCTQRQHAAYQQCISLCDPAPVPSCLSVPVTLAK